MILIAVVPHPNDQLCHQRNLQAESPPWDHVLSFPCPGSPILSHHQLVTTFLKYPELALFIQNWLWLLPSQLGVNGCVCFHGWHYFPGISIFHTE